MLAAGAMGLWRTDCNACSKTESPQTAGRPGGEHHFPGERRALCGESTLPDAGSMRFAFYTTDIGT